MYLGVKKKIKYIITCKIPKESPSILEFKKGMKYAIKFHFIYSLNITVNSKLSSLRHTVHVGGSTHCLEVLIVSSTCLRSWTCLSGRGDCISVPDKSLFNCHLPYIAATTPGFLQLIPVHVLACKTQFGQSCFLLAIRNTRGKHWQMLYAPRSKKVSFSAYPER